MPKPLLANKAPALDQKTAGRVGRPSHAEVKAQHLGYLGTEELGNFKRYLQEPTGCHSLALLLFWTDTLMYPTGLP